MTFLFFTNIKTKNVSSDNQNATIDTIGYFEKENDLSFAPITPQIWVQKKE